MFNQQISTLVRNVAGTLQPARGLLGRTSSCKQISSPITFSSSDEEHTHIHSHTASAVNSSPHCHHVCTGGYLSLERTAGTYLSLNSLHFFFPQTLHTVIFGHICCSQWTFQLISWCKTANHWQEKWLLSLSTSHITLTSEFCCDELLRHCRCLTSAYMSVHCSVVSAPTGKITSTWTLKLILWWWNLLNSNPKRGLAHLRAWKH